MCWMCGTNSSVHLVLVDVDVELSFDVYAVKLTADVVNAVGGVPVDVVHKRLGQLFVFFSFVLLFVLLSMLL